MLDQDARDKALSCTVVSLIPWDLLEEKPGLYPGRFKILASDGVTPTVKHVTKSMHFVYLDDTRGSLPARDTSDEVANSICTDYISSQLGVEDGCRPGIFWLPGVLLTEEVVNKHKTELAEAKACQDRWLLKLCKIADDDWNRYHKHNAISDFQRIAAKMINWDPEDHEWMRAEVHPKPFQGKTTTCIACNSVLEGDPILCKHCGCILKMDAYNTIKFANKKES